MTAANTDWLHDAKWGVFTHWGPDGEYNAGVDSFDVELLARQLVELQCPYYFIMVGQNSGRYCAPNSTYDRLLGRVKPRFLLGQHRAQQVAQPLEGGVAVARLGAVLLGLDRDDAGRRNTLVVECQQAFAHPVGQRSACGDVELQVNRRRHLVDVLAARTARADGGQYDLVHRHGDVVAYDE